MEIYKANLNNMELLRQYLGKNDYRACELSVANNIIWSDYYNVQFTIIEDMLSFGRFEVGKPIIMSYPYGVADERKAFDAIINEFEKCGNKMRMYLVSEEAFKKIDTWYPGKYAYTINRDESDYLYEYETLSTLSGKKLHGKRNHINRFLENHPDYEYERINEDNKSECNELLKNWVAAGNGEDGEKSRDYEQKAIEFALEHMDELDLLGALIRVDGKICAFTMGEELTEDTFVVHFEKADATIQGAYPMINREFVRRELKGYKYINREEDMGLAGLRYAKSTYQPICILNKGYVTTKRL